VKIKRINSKLPERTGHHFLETSDFDDLVFENRNREYGAYQLRKGYNRVLFTVTIAVSLFVSAVVVIPFLVKPGFEEIAFGGGGYSVAVRFENLEQPEEKIYASPVPPPEKTKVPETVKYVPPEVVDSVISIEETQMTTDDALASQDNEVTDATGSGFGEDLFPGGDGTGSEEPLLIVEVMPSFKGGGLSKFAEWVGKHTNYPQSAVDGKIRGTVFLTFIVERDGSVSNVTVTKGVHPLLDNEAVKVISESPKWTPGLQRGHPVRVIFRIPLIFV
jgi:protein TonB